MEESWAQKGSQSTSALLTPTKMSIALMRDLVALSSSFSKDSDCGKEGSTSLLGPKHGGGDKIMGLSQRVGWDVSIPFPMSRLVQETDDNNSSQKEDETVETFSEGGMSEERDATDVVAGVKT